MFVGGLVHVVSLGEVAARVQVFTDLAPDVDEIILRVAADLRHVRRVAVSGDHVSRLQSFEARVPAFQPCGGVGLFKDRQQALVERHVAGDDQTLVGQPDDDVAG